MDFRQEFRPQAVCLLTTCFFASLVGVSLVYLGMESPPPDSPSAAIGSGVVSGQAEPDSFADKSDQTQTPVRYIMKNHGGRLAVFEVQKDSPSLVFDVYINTLPEYDQMALQEGITVEGEDALSKLIEDYVS